MLSRLTGRFKHVIRSQENKFFNFEIFSLSKVFAVRLKSDLQPSCEVDQPECRMGLGSITTMFYFSVNELRCCGTRYVRTEPNIPKSMADLREGSGGQPSPLYILAPDFG